SRDKRALCCRRTRAGQQLTRGIRSAAEAGNSQVAASCESRQHSRGMRADMPDTIQRFLFEHAPVRGEIVHLDATWRAVLERHDYPPAVRALLGEMMAAAALLTATLKFGGTLIMQIQGSG